MKSCSVAERVTNDEFKFCTSLQLFGFLGQFHENASYHYYITGVPNESKSAFHQYDSRQSKKGGHDFRNEHKCLMNASDLVDLNEDKLVLSI
mmetsp:Transcript_1519/g.4741  ORF Transcript_1519/g.4741 Transcript_1519/m.4741 type:complete len:92 (+) Transcript_1519:349-624(+)